MGNQSFRNQCEIRYEIKLIGILNFLLCSIFKRTKQSMYFTVYKYLFIFNIYKHCHIWPMSEWIVYFTFTVVCLETKVSPIVQSFGSLASVKTKRDLSP